MHRFIKETRVSYANLKIKCEETDGAGNKIITQFKKEKDLVFMYFILVPEN